MTHSEALEHLKNNHFTPGILTEVGKLKETLSGLFVDCPAIILMDDMVNRIRELLGDQWAVNGFKNQGRIEITKIQQKQIEPPK